ncbi:MAG TPA: preprotein translocase subunit SecA [Phycisphaerae bacterium]|nr:preprotein translocase subunit SecA [Phycisphaerae bacterium]
MALEVVGEIFGKAARAVFGSRNERLLRGYGEVVDQTSALEPEFESLSDEGLRAKTGEFRRRYQDGESLDSLLPEAFAAAREAAKRTVWLGCEEAPPDFHPDVQDRIRRAMRGEASLIDPETGKPIETYDLYGMRPYDVQLIGAMVLHEGKIAEMATGEGKTLVAALAVYLNALSGRFVHIVSTNDYLVRVGRQWNEPIFRRLGLSVGAIQAGMDSHERKPHYACDVTYGTNNEFGFDYLRDNMKTSLAEQVQGDLAYAIVDECDSVLIDEARTPLIISGPAFESTDKYQKADAIARQLKPNHDFEVKEKEHQCPLTEEGVRRAEQLAGVGSFYVAGNMDWPHLIDQSLRAHHLYHCDKHYVVRGDDVIIVDEFTGRLMPGRQWSDGLHQAVEAKENIRIKEETQTLATITLQNYFRMYDKLSGMTGTAMTEASEFDKIYGLETVMIPPNRPLSRTGHADVVFRTEKEKHQAIIEEIKAYYDRGRPVLVGTTSIENNELLSRMLERTYGIPHEVLNAKFHEKEAQIVAKAGQQHVGRDGNPKGNITVATNMAGRGTDIKLGPGVVNPTCFGPWDVNRQAIPSDFGHKCCIGCPEYNPKTNCAHCFKPKADPAFPKRGQTECHKNPPCGLHVIGTERHEARRIDNQLRGRSGRQGDPGSSRFFLSLEDDLMRIFARDWVSTALQKLGMEEGMALEHRWLTRGIENAQKKVEERNFGFRKHLLEYDEVMDRQRKIFYGRRQNILAADDLRDFVWDLLTESVETACDSYLSDTYSLETIAEWARRHLGIQVDIEPLRGKDAEALSAFLKDEAKQWARDTIADTLPEFIPDVDESVEGDEPPPKPDYRALASWAKSHFGVELKQGELKRSTADEILENLSAAAAERIDAADCSPINEFLEAHFREAALADWANKKFELDLKPTDFEDLDREAAARLLTERLKSLYAEKERSYPIEFAIEEYLTPQVGHGNQDFEGLAAWVSRVYLTEIKPETIRHRDPRTVRDRLLAVAHEFGETGRLRRTIDQGIKAHWPAEGREHNESWRPLAQWAKETLGVELVPEQLAAACREPQQADEETEAPPSAEQRVADFLEARARTARRSRMTELERYLLLQVHDTSWKDHLHEMDRLKSNVGLRGYAQKDPVIEYKREGLETFERMLDSAREKFTDLFFRARWVRQEALARIWAGQESRHALAASAYDAQRRAAMEQHRQARMAEEDEAVKQIVRTSPKVGRNDPCPCGSGKKHKKCCGRRA